MVGCGQEVRAQINGLEFKLSRQPRAPASVAGRVAVPVVACRGPGGYASDWGYIQTQPAGSESAPTKFQRFRSLTTTRVEFCVFFRPTIDRDGQRTVQ